MCGIVGYTGPREAGPILIEGLERLEYRGYDSAGIALVDDAGDMFVEKRAGKLANLRTAIADRTPHAAIGLAHTRWATHGRPNDLNAHPHQDCTGEITVIHNGIIENFRELRDGLEARGHRLTSETDTEAIAHLIEEAYQGDLADAVRARPPPAATAPTRSWSCTAARATGSWGPARTCRSIVGLGDGESFLASDVAAILAHTDRVVFLEEGDVADLRPWGVTITDVAGGPVERAITTIDWSPEAAEKGGYEHFMLKEIHEQPEALAQSLTGRVHRDGRSGVEELDRLADTLRAVDRVELVACGSAYYASLVGAAAIQAWTGHAGSRDRRIGVPVQPAAARRADARHRRHAVGRDRRHHRARAARPRAWLPGHRGDQHRRLGDHPRGRCGPVPAGRSGDRGRRVEDVRDAGRDAGDAGRRHRPGPRARWTRPTSWRWGRRCAPCRPRPRARSRRPRSSRRCWLGAT